MESAAKRARDEELPAAEALLDLYSGMVMKPSFQTRFQLTDPVRFVCDCGLGGLARWLRAAGYEAWWNNPVQDDALVARGR